MNLGPNLWGRNDHFFTGIYLLIYVETPNAMLLLIYSYIHTHMHSDTHTYISIFIYNYIYTHIEINYYEFTEQKLMNDME